jgi:hypothetical protein
MILKRLTLPHLAIATITLFPRAENTRAQDLEPIPQGTITESDRESLNSFLEKFRSHGDYHAMGRVRLHIQGEGKQVPDSSAPSMLIYAHDVGEYIIKSNQYYRIWGDHVLNTQTGVRSILGCGPPFGYFDDSAAVSEKDSLSRLAAMPLLTIVDMLKEPRFINAKLEHVTSISFEEQRESPSRRFRVKFYFTDGESQELSFDSDAKFLTSAHHTFSPELRPPGISDMFAEWTLDSASMRPERDRRNSHRREVRSEIRRAERQVTSDDDMACAGEPDGPHVYAGTPGKSGMRTIVNWLCRKAGFECCAGRDE